MKPKIKPRNPFVVLAKFRKAGSHEKPAKSLRRQEKQSLAKAVKQAPESWHKRISIECASAMTSANQGVAQWVARLAWDEEVAGSSPATLTIRIFWRHHAHSCSIRSPYGVRAL